MQLKGDKHTQQTVLSETVRAGLGPVADYFARALTSDSVAGDEQRYRAVLIGLRLCGALDLWRLYSWTEIELSPVSWWVVFGVACAGIVPRFDRISTWGIAAGYWVALYVSFPFTWNHIWLAVYMFTWLAFVSPRTVDGRKLAMAGVRSIVVYSLIAAGVQKVLHTTYFRGEFLTGRAWQFAHGIMGDFLFTDRDMANFTTLESVWYGQRLVPESVTVKIAANIVWIGEIVAGILLLIPRTFYLGLAAVVAIMVPIQASTLEFGFLGIVLAALVAYVPSRWLKAAPWIIALYVSTIIYLWAFDPFQVY